MFKKVWFVFTILMICTLLIASCAPAPAQETAAAVEPTVAEKAEQEPEGDTAPEAEKEAPETLKIALITSTTSEHSWNNSMFQSLLRRKDENYHGMKIEPEIVENVSFADVERVAREYANSGDYGLLMLHTTYNDAAIMLRKEFPDQLVSLTATVFDEHEPCSNVYLLTSWPANGGAYLTGYLAGLTTKSNILGVVGSFPYSSINMPVNAFIDGARAANPAIKVKVTFIESWYDPATAREAAEAQINAGADVIFATIDGHVEATAGHEGVYAVGYYADVSHVAPDKVIASAVALWDPITKYMIDAYWEKQVNGVAYCSPEAHVDFDTADGMSDISINDDLVDAAIVEKVMAVRQKILDREIVVEPSIDPPVSD